MLISLFSRRHHKWKGVTELKDRYGWVYSLNSRRCPHCEMPFCVSASDVPKVRFCPFCGKEISQ